jgi:hypothetical protein
MGSDALRMLQLQRHSMLYAALLSNELARVADVGRSSTCVVPATAAVGRDSIAGPDSSSAACASCSRSDASMRRVPSDATFSMASSRTAALYVCSRYMYSRRDEAERKARRATAAGCTSGGGSTTRPSLCICDTTAGARGAGSGLTGKAAEALEILRCGSGRPRAGGGGGGVVSGGPIDHCGN